eukprot:539402-Rhodomonas_salina.1
MSLGVSETVSQCTVLSCAAPLSSTFKLTFKLNLEPTYPLSSTFKLNLEPTYPLSSSSTFKLNPEPTYPA